MAPPIYGGIVNLDNGDSTASIISGVLAPTGIFEFSSGVSFSPTATVATFGRGWTRSAFAAVDGSVFLVRAGDGTTIPIHLSRRILPGLDWQY